MRFFRELFQDVSDFSNRARRAHEAGLREAQGSQALELPALQTAHAVKAFKERVAFFE